MVFNSGPYTDDQHKSMEIKDMDDNDVESKRNSGGTIFENDSDKMQKRSSYKQVQAASVMSGREDEKDT